MSWAGDAGVAEPAECAGASAIVCRLRGQQAAAMRSSDDDELPFPSSPQAGRLVRACMEGVAALTVPLRVRLSCGPSWGELQEMDI